MSLQSFFSTLGRSLNIFDSDRPSIYSSNPEEKTVFSELGNVIQGAWNDYTGNTANQANIDYQKDYNEQVFKRADSQYQRTVADLRAAGLSSQLAAGSPSTVAGASSAPQRTVGNESAAIERLVGMITAMKQTDANATLAAAQADKARADAASINVDTKLKNLELGSYGERTSVSIAVQRSQARLYSAQTQLMQIEGQSKGALIQSEIQKNLTSSRHNEALIRLVENQIKESEVSIPYTEALTDKARSEKLEIDKRTELLVKEIATETARKENVEASTASILMNTTKASLDFVIDYADFLFKRDHGDAPSSTEVSSSQAEEKRKDRIHDYIMKGISALTSVGLGVGGFMFGASRGINKKMFGDDHIDPWNIVR